MTILPGANNAGCEVTTVWNMMTYTIVQQYMNEEVDIINVNYVTVWTSNAHVRLQIHCTIHCPRDVQWAWKDRRQNRDKNRDTVRDENRDNVSFVILWYILYCGVIYQYFLNIVGHKKSTKQIRTIILWHIWHLLFQKCGNNFVYGIGYFKNIRTCPEVIEIAIL